MQVMSYEQDVAETSDQIAPKKKREPNWTNFYGHLINSEFHEMEAFTRENITDLVIFISCRFMECQLQQQRQTNFNVLIAVLLQDLL
jgi:hypothetical protein